LSVTVAKLDGRIVRDLVSLFASLVLDVLTKGSHEQVSGNGKGFVKGLGWWFALSVPSTYTNAMVCTVPGLSCC
jgi:ATP-binding cassette subfamily D (ALD) long-chain fatty acid import protein